VVVVSRRSSWTSSSDHLWEWLIGLVLLVWGVTLVVSGVGLAHAPVGRAVDTYWPLAFMAWGLAAIVARLVNRRGDVAVPVAVLMIAVAILGGHMHVGHVNGWTLVWAGLILFIALEILVPGIGRRSRRRSIQWDFGDLPLSPGATRGDAGGERNLRHFIGDIRLDLSDVELPNAESEWTVSALIGDITVLVPQGLPVDVEADVRVGDVTLFNQRADGLGLGIGHHLRHTTPGYAEAVQKVAIRASLLVGDITVMRF
jgi:lia operon protein LiaF